MYLKVLARDDNDVYVFDGIRRLHFFKQVIPDDELHDRANEADFAIPRWGVTAEGPPTEKGIHIAYLELLYEDGKRETVMFDSLAFYCNETGKAVERFLAN